MIQQLQNDEFRFIKLRPKNKIPIELDWNTKNNYKHNDIELLEHIRSGGNYGVATGFGDLIVIDADVKEVSDLVKYRLPETLEITTGSGGTHSYFKCPLQSPIRLSDKVAGDKGDVQAKGKQVVGPNCIHPNGKQYKVTQDRPIATITPEQLRFAFRDLIKTDTPINKNERGDLIDINILTVIPAGFKNQGKWYVGDCPETPSNKAKGNKYNFGVHNNKNYCVCWHHGTVGGSLELIALQEGLLKCSDMRSGCLRGDLFKNVLKIAKEKYGVKIDSRVQEKIKGKNEFELITQNINELRDRPEGGIWRVDKFVPIKGITLIGGPTGVFKTTTCLEIATCIATGMKFLNKFASTKCKVLYINKENQEFILKERLKLMNKDLDADSIRFVNFGNFKFDRDEWVWALREFLTNNPAFKVIIVDPFRRTHDLEEDKSGDMSQILDLVLQSIIQDFEVGFLFMHHTRKKASAKKVQSVDVDEFRGSSELANYVDVAYILKAIKDDDDDKKFVIYCAKPPRMDVPIEKPIKVKVCWSDEKLILLHDGEVDYEADVVESADEIAIYLRDDQKCQEVQRSIILKDLDIKSGTGDKALKRLIKSKKVKKVKRGIYQYVQNVSEVENVD